MTSPVSILVVDDSAHARELVSEELAEAGFRVATASDGVEAWTRFRAQRPDLVVSDIRMPGQDGFALLRRIREVSDLPVILLTAHADTEAAIAAIRAGATDFLCFPDELSQLIPQVQRLVNARSQGEPEDAASELVPGSAPAMRELRARVRALARLDVPVLVSGEPGTGRRRVAEAVHRLASGLGPLLTLDAEAPALPSERAAVLLSGVERWSAAAQDHWAALLRGARASHVSRVFALATPALPLRVERLEFRRDLWQRLARFRLEVPPLRARSEDIPPLARDALAAIGRALGREALSLTPSALEGLRHRPWPGNLPELREVLEEAVVFAPSARIDREELERAVESVIAGREDSLAKRRAEKESQDRRQLIQLLEACGGNIAEMARRLSLTRGAVSYRLKKHGLTR